LGDCGDPALALIVVGLSAGGFEPLRTLLCSLPTGFPGALVVARHTARSRSLPKLIRRWTRHPVVEAASGVRLDAGVVYLCPAQRHIVVTPDGTLQVSSKERVAFVRPSIDWLFESAAGAYGSRATAVLLSGANADGARGAYAIRRVGGLVLVQAMQTCEHPQMSAAALRAQAVSAELAPEDIAPVVLDRIRDIERQYRDAWTDPFASDSDAAGSLEDAAS
jgi:two-component system chemotaxis response regulator CheB